MSGSEGRQSITGAEVVATLTELISVRGKPESIRVDNGPEFTSVVLDQWAHWKRVTLDFSRPGKPTDNAYVESFTSRFRQECLNESWFLSMPDAEIRIEAWRQDYNEHRPHSALGNLTPVEFARQSSKPPSATLQTAYSQDQKP